MDFSELRGKTIKGITGLKKGGDTVVIYTEDDHIYQMYHSQDCCESVDIEDVCGDPEDLIGHPILLAEVHSHKGNTPASDYDSQTYTFYRLRTIQGTVVIRWYGTSNGYYSESVDFEEITPSDWSN